ncbi:prepilin cleavage protein [Legionella qingyii]|uniref:Prepilin cleavage protein n=1 Tax=Legionella qingyii TaxID=2184757 RepID=A0A317U3U2_9GAMM|nr:prepilin cleavage protein [Legionella qingyii]PWY55905.1 prepilin cleavage protein [Legionella qingyii]RUR22483.1 prepilin cleavage protein [Legionella qingyii]RUR27954.1 prepilin cleavage protein [Legionella qingyii]
MKKQMGLSLTEVLISLFLASVIMTELIQLYLESKHQYLETEKILAMRFDLQWVSDLLSDSIRRAGFTPCLGLDRLQTIDRRNHHNKIRALNISNYPNQFIQINRMNEHFAKIVKIQNSTGILVQNSVIFHKRRPILIADCEHAEIQEIFDIEPQSEHLLITLNKPLYFSYNTSPYVGEYLEEKWFIKNNANHEDTLHYQLVHTEEITPLIHFMHTRNRRVKEKQFLEISMGLDENKTHELRVLVRGS